MDKAQEIANKWKIPGPYRDELEKEIRLALTEAATAAAEGMREKCARVCDGAISKGGMRNKLAMKIRKLSLSDPSVVELVIAEDRLKEARKYDHMPDLRSPRGTQAEGGA